MRKIICFLFLGMIFSCSPEVATNPEKKADLKFSLVSKEKSNIDFINKLIDDPLTDKNVMSYPHYFNGAGVGVGDFNKDGKPDLFFAGNEVDNRLYINEGDLVFKDITEGAGINQNKNWSSGVNIVDINEDGYDDIYVCQHGPFKDPSSKRENLLYINNGDLSFTEQAKSYGLNDGNHSVQSVFFDYDKDGDLDCYILNSSKYVLIVLAAIFEDLEDKKNLEAASGNLYENLGNQKFKRVTEQAGVLKHGFGLGVVATDINNDGWQDLYVTNDYSVPDFLYINQKDGTFKESIKEYTKQISFYGMGVDIADLNNDNHLDICVVDMAADDHFRDKTLMASMDTETFWYYINHLGYQSQYMFNSLQLNNGRGQFSNIANLAGIARSDWSWAALLSDFNLDGQKDLFVSNGYRRYARDNDFRLKMADLREKNGGTIPMALRKEAYELLPEMKLPNRMYLNQGDLNFESREEQIGLEIPTYSYGAALSDLDNDGDMDLVLNNLDQDAMIFKNDASSNANYLKLKLKGRGANDNLGSKVYVSSGGETQMQEYFFTRGYESSMEHCLIFGLGDKSKIDSLKIIWPDGNMQIENNLQVNKEHLINYKEGKRNTQRRRTSSQYFASKWAAGLGLEFVHKENDFNDFEKEILLPHKQSTLGPALAEGDVNKDGLTDIFVGGAKGQAGILYMQSADGKFTPAESQPWNMDFASEDVAAIFFDPNKDGNLDLIILSGGGGDFEGETSTLDDRFYANIGNGTFRKAKNVLPELGSASATVKAQDLNGDGYVELIIASAAVPGKYPQTKGLKIYQMTPKKLFIDVTDKFIDPEIIPAGLVKDIACADLNGDDKIDLLLVGEWTEVKILLQKDGRFVDGSNELIEENKYGWWYSVSSGDLDNDGDLDFVLGNIGKNYKHKPTKKKPLYLFANDFDDSGSLDVVLGKHYEDRVVPARGRQCSSEQMPFIEDKFESYKSFADASIEDILGKDKLDGGIKLQADDFASYILWNNDSGLEFEKLANQAQIFPIMDSEIMDVNGDKKLDLVLAGNMYNTEVETPRLDAGMGLVMLNKGQQKFEVLNTAKSGFYAPNNAKKIAVLQRKNDRMVIVANNNASLDCFSLSQ